MECNNPSLGPVNKNMYDLPMVRLTSINNPYLTARLLKNEMLPPGQFRWANWLGAAYL